MFFRFTLGIHQRWRRRPRQTLKGWISFKVNCLTRPKLRFTPIGTAYILFYKSMSGNKELKGTTFVQGSTIIWREQKKVPVNDKEMEKYMNLYETEKQWYEKDLESYQDHIAGVEIISLRHENIGAKADLKADAKASRSRYHLFWESILIRWQQRIE